MIAELRALDPRPGAAFGGEPVQPVVPDVTCATAPDGSWHVELNSDTLPRLLVDQRYHAASPRGAARDEDKTFSPTALPTPTGW